MIKFFDIIKQDKILNQKDAINIVLECPKLLAEKLETKIKEIVFLFELYHKIPKKQVFYIFQHFPYIVCLRPRRI